MNELLKLQHLSWRSGFGPDASWLATSRRKDFKEVIKKSIHGSSKSPEELKVVSANDLPSFQTLRQMSPQERREVVKKSRGALRDLNLAWLKEMVSSEHQLREKMSLFWHGHFACRTQNVLFSQQLLQVIRQNALGNFGDLLAAVSKSPAMLQFLNNQQNRRQHPNENFAREVMELFTLGRGHYTEKDVKEAARAFTGWGFDQTGAFKFRKFLHDDGQKTLLGKTGNFDGDDVLKILLEQKQTANFISQKILRFFVGEEVDDAIAKKAGDLFYQTGYAIKDLINELFSSDWFYDAKYVGNRIKSPVELLAGMQRVVPVQFANEELLLLFQRILGQVLFYPPSVAGWPGGKNWIDSSTLMFRMRLPQIVFYSQDLNIHPKEMPDELDNADGMMQQQLSDYLRRQYADRVKATVNWEPYLKAFEGVKEEDLPEMVASTLLVYVPPQFNEQLVNKYTDTSSRENYIKTLTIDIMSMPEYQLC